MVGMDADLSSVNVTAIPSSIVGSAGAQMNPAMCFVKSCQWNVSNGLLYIHWIDVVTTVT
jgi:hypothetical protein